MEVRLAGFYRLANLGQHFRLLERKSISARIFPPCHPLVRIPLNFYYALRNAKLLMEYICLVLIPSIEQSRSSVLSTASLSSFPALSNLSTIPQALPN